MKKTILIISISFLLSMPFLTLADDKPLVPCTMGECTLCDFFVLINNVIKFVMIDLVPPLAVFMILIGGVMYFMGGMSANMIARGKETFKAVAIGLLIVYTAWIVVDTILVRSGVVEKTGTAWWKIECETTSVGSGEYTSSGQGEEGQETFTETAYCKSGQEATGGSCTPNENSGIFNEGINSNKNGYYCTFKIKDMEGIPPGGEANVQCEEKEEEDEEEEGEPVSGRAKPGEESITVTAPCEEGTEVTGGKCDAGDDSEVSDQGTTENNEYFCTFESTSSFSPNSPNYVPPSGTATPICTVPDMILKTFQGTKYCEIGKIAVDGSCEALVSSTTIKDQGITDDTYGYFCIHESELYEQDDEGNFFLDYTPVKIEVECKDSTAYESGIITPEDPNTMIQQTVTETLGCGFEDQTFPWQEPIKGECVAVDPEKTEVVGTGELTEDGYTCTFRGKENPNPGMVSNHYYVPEGIIKVTCISE